MPKSAAALQATSHAYRYVTCYEKKKTRMVTESRKQSHNEARRKERCWNLSTRSRADLLENVSFPSYLGGPWFSFAFVPLLCILVGSTESRNELGMPAMTPAMTHDLPTLETAPPSKALETAACGSFQPQALKTAPPSDPRRAATKEISSLAAGQIQNG